MILPAEGLWVPVVRTSFTRKGNFRCAVESDYLGAYIFL